MRRPIYLPANYREPLATATAWLTNATTTADALFAATYGDVDFSEQTHQDVEKAASMTKRQSKDPSDGGRARLHAYHEPRWYLFCPVPGNTVHRAVHATSVRDAVASAWPDTLQQASPLSVMGVSMTQGFEVFRSDGERVGHADFAQTAVMWASDGHPGVSLERHTAKLLLASAGKPLTPEVRVAMEHALERQRLVDEGDKDAVLAHVESITGGREIACSVCKALTGPRLRRARAAHFSSTGHVAVECGVELGSLLRALFQLGVDTPQSLNRIEALVQGLEVQTSFLEHRGLPQASVLPKIADALSLLSSLPSKEKEAQRLQALRRNIAQSIYQLAGE